MHSCRNTPPSRAEFNRDGPDRQSRTPWPPRRSAGLRPASARGVPGGDPRARAAGRAEALPRRL